MNMNIKSRSAIMGMLLLTAFSTAQERSPRLDEYAINVSPRQPHQFVFTNKIAAFWFGETQQENLPAHQGYTILEQRYLRDYEFWQQETLLVRDRAESITLYPDRLERRFPEFTETFYFLDSLNAILIKISAKNPLDLRFRPRFDEVLSDPEWRWDEAQQAAIGKTNHLPTEKPCWAAVAAWGSLGELSPIIESGVNKTGKPPSGGNTGATLGGLAAAGVQEGYFAVVFEFEREGLERTLETLRGQADLLVNRRRERFENLLSRAGLIVPDTSLNRSFAWALFSMDDLVTRQRGEGIWAGLPWFNNYWGRDSFISLPGALLCTGQFEKAKEVLVSFSKFQNLDANSPFYGRIPNRVMLNEIIYNTTDGTPWFALACEKYVQYSGDSDFIGEIFPALKKAMDGAIRYHLDEYGFLTHANAETWMDAAGSEGPWSPRGNRAVEIQALWREQIRISIDWAERLGYKEWAESWRLLENRLRQNFKYYFWNREKTRLADHLNEDNSPDSQIRPNSVFALTIPRGSVSGGNPLLEPAQQEAVLQELMSNLVYPWGVASLAQSDSSFHPYHHYPPYYVPDAAYHNGIIWTWVNGPLISVLLPYNTGLAVSLLKEAARQILEEDAIGSYSELLESWPRPGSERVRISGTVSQAWNLAEFIRNWHEDLLGIRPDLANKRIYFSPMLPPELFPADFKIRIGDDLLTGNYTRVEETWEFRLQGKRSLPDLTVQAKIPFESNWIVFETPWNGAEPLSMKIFPQKNTFKVLVNGRAAAGVTVEAREILADLAFLKPAMNNRIPALRGPQYQLISPGDATRARGRMAPILFDVKDRAQDDKGSNGKYVYPTNPNFKKGIFDGRRVRIWKDEQYYYFEIDYQELADPGWKPEPGYQLTYTAITLNFEKLVGVRRSKVGMNANYSVPMEYAYNFVIYVGNGFRVVDAKGETVAEYRPPDTQHPIGFAKEKKVRFSVPVKYLSDKHLRNAVVLIGGQDDHGGGGIGEFREVRRSAGEWNGGGGEQESGNSNVYDEIYLRR